MTLALYGHDFSSYTWKAKIALYATGLPFDFRSIGPDQPEHTAFVQAAGPGGKFPVLADGPVTVFETTAIIEYLHRNHAGGHGLLPDDAEAAAEVRLLDRVYDNYVMANMQEVVNEYIRSPQAPDADRVAEARARLQRAYEWLEARLPAAAPSDHVTLVECAAAPSLFYADWVLPIPDNLPRLQQWRAHLLALPAVARCVEEARPFRPYFPLGAPDRD